MDEREREAFERAKDLLWEARIYLTRCDPEHFPYLGNVCLMEEAQNTAWKAWDALNTIDAIFENQEERPE